MRENEDLSLWPEPEAAQAEPEDASEILGHAEVVLRIGDARDLIREVPDGSIDLIATSPPYLALRSYLPADHPDKAREMGSERSPAEFLDNLLGLTAEFRRVLAPHGSIAIELGDTYAGSGGAGGDYGPKGGGDDAGNDRYPAGRSRHLREGQQRWSGSAKKRAENGVGDDDRPARTGRSADAWPLERSLCAIPALYQVALAYGINPLTGEESPAGRWRVRNLVVHGRPNPPVGALGDKWRPACSYWTVACVDRRWFDLDGVRKASLHDGARLSNEAGAPPLDWIDDQYDEDLWTIQSAPYSGAHYATFSPELIRRFIVSMCPTRVCTVCGKPSVRITGTPKYIQANGTEAALDTGCPPLRGGLGAHSLKPGARGSRLAETISWSDCGHTVQVLGVDVPAWRRGLVLDPFGGSGTTGMVATGNGRNALLFDLNAENIDLVRQRCGFFLREEIDADD